MPRVLRLFFIIVYIFVYLSCVEAADAERKTTFKEDFSAKNPSSSVWGYANFSLYNFKAEPDMVSNSSGINYLRLGTPVNDGIYPTGFIYTKNYFPFGSYSARIKVSGSPGVVASFFTCTEIADIFTTGTHDEIDFEFITANPHAVLLTTWKMATKKEGKDQTRNHNSYLWENPYFDIREWHVYRFDWFPDKVDFYIDGVKVWTSTIAIPQKPMQIALHIFTHAAWKEVRYPPKGEAVQMTDWVEYRKFE